LLVSDQDSLLLKDSGLLKDEKIVATGPDWDDGYKQQMRDKLYADTYTDADYICHTDSDCVWLGDFNPSDMLENNLPIYWIETINDPKYPWFPIVEEDLGFRTGNLSFMRQHPFLWPRDIYPKFREFMQSRHGVPLNTYIQAKPYRRFIEFENMGNWAIQKNQSAFVWKTFDNSSPRFCWQNWSWGGLNDDIREKLEELVK
jgi:hypothetical protein